MDDRPAHGLPLEFLRDDGAALRLGLAIEGPVEEFRQVLPCVTPDRLEGTYSRIVLAVKAQATEVALKQLLPHLAPDGFVLSAQNGLNDIRAMSTLKQALDCELEFGGRDAWVCYYVFSYGI